VGAQNWRGLEDLFIALAVILVIGGSISYFYSITYVTILGTFIDYPYRSYAGWLVFGFVFFFVASFVSHIKASDVEAKTRLGQTETTLPLPQPTRSRTAALRYCQACGAQVPLNARRCPICANRLNRETRTR
jgi:uncharacterized paraquat-inducible protein A